MFLRRMKAIRLVEELPVRRQHLQLVLQRLREISHRMDAVRRELAQPHDDGDRARRRELRKELHRLMRITHETPGHAPPPACPHRRRSTYARDASPKTLDRQPAARRVDRQALSKPRHQLSRPDPRGKHRTVAGGRQVRAGPRLQVLDLCHVVDSPGDQPFHRRPQPHDPRSRPHAHHGQQGAGRRQPGHADAAAAVRRSRRRPTRRASRSTPPAAR